MSARRSHEAAGAGEAGRATPVRPGVNDGRHLPLDDCPATDGWSNRRGIFWRLHPGLVEQPTQEQHMKVTLAGPDDLGYWFLHDEDGNGFPLVEDHAGHPAAAALFGWTAPEGVTD